MHTKRKFRSPEQWQELFQLCRSSGLSDHDWCEQNNIPVSTFYNAVSRCRKIACQIPEPSATKIPDVHEVVPVDITEFSTLPECTPSLPSITTIQPAIKMEVNGYQIEINNNASKELIYNTFQALRSLC